MTNKLKLKRTPEEEAQHRLRKERRREKRKRRQDDYYTTHGAGSSSSKRVHVDETEEPTRKWASSDEDEMEYGPQPAPATPSHTPPSRSHAHKPDYDAIKAEVEEKMFREKMFEAMGDDDRLDSVEAQFNDFAQVPDRWRTASSTSQIDSGKSRAKNFYDDDDLLKLDPRHMDDEEYTEWIRAGMYRKTHAEEYAEQQRKKAAQAARRAEEKARKAETARLEKAAEEERKRKKLERESRKMDYAREEYNSRWTTLLTVPVSGEGEAMQSNAQVLTFDDIPWPIATVYRSRPDKTRLCKHIGVSDLTTEAVTSFLLPAPGVVDPPDDDQGAKHKKDRKDKLREAFLRFHPDKFEGRFMKRFKEEDREEVREAIGQVSRILNSLMSDGV